MWWRMLAALALAIFCFSWIIDGDASEVVLRTAVRDSLPQPQKARATAANPSSAQLPAIPSNFDRRQELLKDVVPSSAHPDVVGAFRFICNAGHISRDDPIVYPAQKGRSHLHQFFGNTLTDADSTYESLRSSGDSTCMGPLNRSAYWIPAMMDGTGNVVRPDYVTVYYKRRPKNDPGCQRQGTACVELPRGLRFVFGYDMITHTSPTGAAYFDCDGPTAKPGRSQDIPTAAAKCPPGNRVGAIINAPDCWNGRDLDSANHRDHMAYASYGSWGYLKCPTTHPYVIASFTLGAWYSTYANLPRWYLSSDDMPGMPRMTGGATFHADWWGAWDDETLTTWTDHCIDKMLNCSDGRLGDGTIMKRPKGFSYEASPRLVRAPD
jgi:hypothetical protein